MKEMQKLALLYIGFISVFMLWGEIGYSQPAQTEETIRPELDSLIRGYYKQAIAAKGRGEKDFIRYADSAVEVAAGANYNSGLAQAHIYRGKLLRLTGNKEEIVNSYRIALALTKKLNNARDMAYLYRLLGYVTFEEYGEYAIADSYYDTAIQIIKTRAVDDSALLGGIYLNKGVNFEKSGLQDSVFAYFFRALDIFEKSKDSLGVVQATNNLASYNHKTGDITTAASQFQKALKYGKNHLNPIQKISISLNLGHLHTRTKNFDRAAQVYERVLTLIPDIKNVDVKASFYHNYGALLSTMKKFNEAVKMLHLARALRKAGGLNEDLTASYYNLGLTYEEWGRPDSQKYYYNRCKLQAKKTKDLNSLYLANTALYKTYQSGGNLSKALEHIQKANKTALESQNLKQIYESYGNLADYYNNSGQYKKAFDYHVLYATRKDSFLDEQSQNTIAELNAQFETERKEREIELLTKENALNDLRIQNQEARMLRKSRQNQLIFVIAALAILSLVIFGVLYRQRFKALYLAKITNNELKALRAQMNPHFIFNALSSVQFYISENQKEKAGFYLSSFSKLTRRILSQSESEKISLADEIETLRLFLELERVRMKGGFDFEVVLDDHIDPDNTEIPSMLIQPLAENAVWHGVSNAKEKGLIEIRFSRNDDQLCVAITDNGTGLPDNSMDKPASHGLKITEGRIARFNKSAGKKSQLTFTTLNPGLRVSFSIPFQELF